MPLPAERPPACVVKGLAGRHVFVEKKCWSCYYNVVNEGFSDLNPYFWTQSKTLEIVNFLWGMIVKKAECSARPRDVVYNVGWY